MTFKTRESSRYTGQPVKLYLIQGANLNDDVPLGPYAFNNGESVITRSILNAEGDPVDVDFIPWPIKNSDISHDGTLDKSDITVTMALGHPDMDTMFLAYPPSQVVNLTIFEGHIGDEVTGENFPASWMGRIVSGAYNDTNEQLLSCVPVSTKIKQPGLRRNYQIGCPHVLFGPQCRASKSAATVVRSVVSVTRNKITLSSALANENRYVGGLLEWANSDNGRKELRTISFVRADGLEVMVRGIARGLAEGTSLSVIRGCNRQMSGCALHTDSVAGGSNIHNYGGQPFIPLENPLSQKNQFY
ncbi:phage BR0599 family protein [Mesorhizobium sp. M0292]|uniref:phage BR0599 family protein n=1 Tax=Mesorhizobium sp. M0292 TaxID=2956929 RepID=UPI0033386213